MTLDNTEKSRRILSLLLLLVTIGPYLFSAIFQIYSFYSYSPSSSAEVVSKMTSIITIYRVTLLWIIFVLGIYFYYVLRLSTLSKENRFLWGVLLIFFQLVAMLLFWYRHIWKTISSDTA